MRLKEARNNKKQTQEQVANFLNIKKQTYQNYELGKRQPDIETLKKLANYFDVSLDYLCDRPFNNNIGFIADEKKDTIKKLIELDEQSFQKAEVYITALHDIN